MSTGSACISKPVTRFSLVTLVTIWGLSDRMNLASSQMLPMVDRFLNLEGIPSNLHIDSATCGDGIWNARVGTWK